MKFHVPQRYLACCRHLYHSQWSINRVWPIYQGSLEVKLVWQSVVTHSWQYHKSYPDSQAIRKKILHLTPHYKIPQTGYLFGGFGKSFGVQESRATVSLENVYGFPTDLRSCQTDWYRFHVVWLHGQLGRFWVASRASFIIVWHMGHTLPEVQKLQAFGVQTCSQKEQVM